MQKKTWVWRQLSGTYNVAYLGAATQSSTLTGWGDSQAFRAVDGLLSNNVDNAEPYTVSATQDFGDTPFAWWQVDFGQDVDVQYVNVFARGEGCCTGRNSFIGWFIGDSQDTNYNTRCTNAPFSISPPCFQPTVSTCEDTPAQCVTGANVVPSLGAPPTACFVTFTCPARGRFLQARKMFRDYASIALGEVQVIASKLLDQPSGRAGMSVATFGGSMVLFGGADAEGACSNELRFFDMLNVAWLPPFTPIGTTPAARAGAFFALLPPPPTGAPSSAFVLFGGYSDTNQLNDMSVLSLPPCPAYDATGVASTAAFHGGSVRYVTCQPYATPVNGIGPLVCQTDGTWRGIVPPCAVAPPAAPTGVAASIDALTGAATVSWTRLTAGQQGYYNQPSQLLAYRVRAAPLEIYEDFSSGTWPAPIAPFNTGLCTTVVGQPCGSKWVGGNWNYMLPKIGACGTGCVSSFPSWLSHGVTHTWDFWSGFLRLDCDLLRYPENDKMDGLTLYRDFPSSIVSPGADRWAFEAFVSLDTYNILSSADHSACIGIVDTSDYMGLGTVEFYSCIRNNGWHNYQIVQQSSQNNQWNPDVFGTAPFSTYSTPYAVYMRMEHDPAFYPQQWTILFKFNRRDAWIKCVTHPDETLMRSGPILPQNIRPALLMRNANTQQLRAVGLVSYFRIGPIACSNTGTTRVVSGAASSALIYGLTQGTAYRFTVEAQTPAGYGPKSALSGFVTPPVAAPTADPSASPLVSQNALCAMQSVQAGSINTCAFAVDGSVDTFAQNNNDAPIGVCINVFGLQWQPYPNGLACQNGYLTIDLGVQQAIKAVTIVARQSAEWASWLDGFQLWAHDVPTFAGPDATMWGTQCNASFFPAKVSTLQGYAATVPCIPADGFSWKDRQPAIGRYVSLMAVQNASFAVVEMQVTSANLVLASYNAPCVLSSTFDPYGGGHLQQRLRQYLRQLCAIELRHQHLHHGRHGPLHGRTHGQDPQPQGLLPVPPHGLRLLRRRLAQLLAEHALPL